MHISRNNLSHWAPFGCATATPIHAHIKTPHAHKHIWSLVPDTYSGLALTSHTSQAGVDGFSEWFSVLIFFCVFSGPWRRRMLTTMKYTTVATRKTGRHNVFVFTHPQIGGKLVRCTRSTLPNESLQPRRQYTVRKSYTYTHTYMYTVKFEETIKKINTQYRAANNRKLSDGGWLVYMAFVSAWLGSAQRINTQNRK